MFAKRKLIIIAFGLVIVVIGAWFYSHSLFRSETSIRASLLKQMPLGSNSVDVREFVDKHGWLVRNYVGNTGFLKLEAGAPSEVVGVTSIKGNLGDYWFMNVTAFWGFDSSNRLVNVWVWKTYDAP
jgi:hypothetical protein